MSKVITMSSFAPKKIPYYLLLILLTLGASLILGFLSFGGIYAMLPVLPLAFAAFFLSVAYEGEIYLQNIKGSLTKLFKNNHLKNQLARAHFLKHFPKDTDSPDCPQFFRDYEKKLKNLKAFEDQKLKKKSKQQRKQIKKGLKDMEELYASLLFPSKTKTTETEEHTAYIKNLKLWFAKEEQNQAKWQIRLHKRRITFSLVTTFSVLSSFFMGVGTTYLSVEVFSAIPWIVTTIPFASWPLIIIPMAIIAGLAYGLLTYNTVTNLINNDTLRQWYLKIRQSLSKGLSVRNVFITTMAVLLTALSIALTVCTAGTWWTIATSARPLFEWMIKIPNFIMGVINPIITGLSAIFFNLQNTAESLDMLDELSSSNLFHRLFNFIKKGIIHLKETENILQIMNPFRWIKFLTFTPLRILLFLGHIISISFDADRMPGIPQIWAMLIALISEGFEDAHYFMGSKHHHHHEHQHGTKDEHHKKDHHDKMQSLLNERLGAHASHTHNTDIPTLILKILAFPIDLLSLIFDFLASKLNKANAEAHQPKQLSLKDAWNKQRGNRKRVEVILSDAKKPSADWNVAHALFLLQNYEKKHFKNTVFGKGLVDQKKEALQNLQKKIREDDASALAKILEEAKSNRVFNQHRLFGWKNEKTDTQVFIEKLPERIYSAPAA
jgi:hypothetical protein